MASQTSMARPSAVWLAGSLSAALWLGSIGLLVLGLHPLLLGAIFTEGRVNLDGAALIALGALAVSLILFMMFTVIARRRSRGEL